jgi:hypothetical protein
MNHLEDLAKEINETIKDFVSMHRKEALTINKLMFEGKIGGESQLISLIAEGLDRASVSCWQKYYKETFDRYLKMKAFW